MNAIDAKLDQLLAAHLGPRLDAALERALARMLGDAQPAPAAAPQTAPKPRPAPKAVKRTKKPPTPRRGPQPGSVADQIRRALTDGPLTESEFAAALAGIDGTEEAKRQAITRLTKSGALVVRNERGVRSYHAGSTERPQTGG